MVDLLLWFIGWLWVNVLEYICAIVTVYNVQNNLLVPLRDNTRGDRAHLWYTREVSA